MGALNAIIAARISIGIRDRTGVCAVARAVATTDSSVVIARDGRSRTSAGTVAAVTVRAHVGVVASRFAGRIGDGAGVGAIAGSIGPADPRIILAREGRTAAISGAITLVVECTQIAVRTTRLCAGILDVACIGSVAGAFDATEIGIVDARHDFTRANAGSVAVIIE
jgi:hypothetical protein